MMLTETAHAKLNLALHVRRRRPDGYHELETLFAFCEDGDVLTAEAADDLSLTIGGPFAQGLALDDGNLVIRAARALQLAAGVTMGARLHLTKNLPIASGIGGGSADAAAALRVLSRLWGTPHSCEGRNPDQTEKLGSRLRGSTTLNFHEIARTLGADVPACLLSAPARGTGTGTDLTPVALSLAGLPVLLVNPGVLVATSDAFQRWDGTDRGPLPEIAHACELDYTYDGLSAEVDGALANPALRNDLVAPAIAIAPEISQVLKALYAQSDVLMTRMSGSGATCFALFADELARDAAQAAIFAAHPAWWTLATKLR
jgi:4-diphosphocytidyl-2-C-methyl-D-erythritol kinase